MSDESSDFKMVRLVVLTKIILEKAIRDSTDEELEEIGDACSDLLDVVIEEVARRYRVRGLKQ